MPQKFYQGLKGLHKPFEPPQRSVKTKISVNFFSSPGIGTGRVKCSPVFQYEMIAPMKIR